MDFDLLTEGLDEIVEIAEITEIDFTPCDQETPWSWKSFD